MSTLQAAPHLQFIPIEALTPWEKNPREISRAKMDALKLAIRQDPEMLLARPVVANEDGTIAAGNMRFRAISEMVRSNGDGDISNRVREWGGVPTFVRDLDEKEFLEVAVRDNQNYGEWVEEDYAGLVVGYLDELEGSAELLGLDDADEKAMRSAVERLIESEEAPPPDLKPRKRAEAWAVTVTFDDKDSRDRFAAQLRQEGHERVSAHAGRMGDT